jgi:hypothetical protein
MLSLRCDKKGEKQRSDKEKRNNEITNILCMSCNLHKVHACISGGGIWPYMVSNDTTEFYNFLDGFSKYKIFIMIYTLFLSN